MSSQKKIEANRRNARRSTGPTSEQGKRNASFNALEEGVFCRKLVVRQDDEEALQALRAELLAQLKPATAMQRLVGDGIVCSAWRCSQALCRETRQLAGADRANTPASAPPPETTITEWYAANSRAANRAKYLLSCALQEIREEGRISTPTAEELDKAFGPGFMQQINEWKTSDFTLLQMVKSFRMKAEIWGTPRLEDSVGALPDVTPDPLQRLHMQEKMLEIQAVHLTEVQQMLQKKEAEQHTSTEPEPAHRYVTAAFKLFVGLVAFYAKLRELRM